MYYEDLYDDFYGEDDFYSESVNSYLDEFVDTLKTRAKKEFIDRLNALEKENKELQEIKKNYNDKIRQLENEYHSKAVKLEREYEEKEYNLYRRPIEEIYPLVSKTYYSATTNYTYVPKCDKCNDDRQFVYVDPLGETHKFSCSCNIKQFYGYAVKEESVKFIKEISIRNGKPCLWVTFNVPRDDDYISGNFFDKDKIISSNKLDKLIFDYSNKSTFRRYEPTVYYFENKEDCEKFVAFVNNNLSKIEQQ